MLTRLIVRLLSRALLSLGVLLGVASYGHHLSGGDPGALWASVGGGALDRAGDALGRLRDGIAAPSPATGGGADGAAGAWRGRDADGVVHYAGTPPADATARRIRLDPERNVVAAPPPAPPAPDGGAGAGPLPGIAGAAAGAGLAAPDGAAR